MKFSACLLLIPALLVGAEDKDFLDMMAVATGDCTPTNQCQASGTPCCGGGSHNTLKCGDWGCSTACHKVVKFGLNVPCRGTGDLCELALVPGDPMGWVCKKFIKAICSKIVDGMTDPTAICDSVGMCKLTGRRCDDSTHLEDQVEDHQTEDEDILDEDQIENADQIKDENEAKDEGEDQVEDADQIEDENEAKDEEDDADIVFGSNPTSALNSSVMCTATNKCEVRGASCCDHSDHGTAACSRSWCETKCLGENVVKHCSSKAALCEAIGMGPEDPLADLCAATWAGICAHHQQHATCKNECGKLDGKRCGSANVLV